MKKTLFRAILVFSFAIPYLANGASPDEQILSRIAPIGDICLIGDACAGGVVVALSGSDSGLQDPQEIYQTFCIACHGTGANNSPIMGDQAAWQPRLDKGLNLLYENAINGFNNNTMPVKGLCMACSDAAIQATVDWMLEAVQ